MGAVSVGTLLLACPRPLCGARAFVVEVRRCSNGSKRRRLECCDCGHRWTHHEGEPPGRRGGLRPGQSHPWRRVTEQEVRAILTATGSATEIARRTGRSYPTVLGILTGRLHADVAPGLPRRISRSCLQCRHWLERSCGLGLPDPQDEGPGFAADCASFLNKVA